MTMASALSRRIFCLLVRKDNPVRGREGTLGGAMRVSVAGCHSAGSSSSSIPPPAAADVTNTEKKVDGWDLARVENILQEASLSDMPVTMKNPFEREQVQCLLCKYQVPVDYKNVRLLSQFVSPFTGRMYGRNITHLCKKQQDIVENAIRKSQDAGFMTVMLKSVEFLKDPKLFDPNNPIKPHNY